LKPKKMNIHAANNAINIVRIFFIFILYTTNYRLFYANLSRYSP